MMVARHEAERTAWLEKLVAVIRLIERVEEPATLRGLGSVHDHFKMGKFLGKGRFGVVRMCTHHLSGQVFAIKIINKNKKRVVLQMVAQNKNLTTDVLDATLQNELRVLRCIKQRIGTTSPFLCNTYEVYEDSHLVCIVMEYLPGGDLFDAIIRQGNFREVDAARITMQLVSGLKSLHWAGIIHRDMKPENVLFTANASDAPGAAMNVKIADFGCSLLMHGKKQQLLQRRQQQQQQQDGRGPPPTVVAKTYLKLRQIVGTPGYMSPEVLQHGHYGPPCDVFAVGVILYIMLVGYPPFWGKTNDEIFARTKSGKVNFFKSDWISISSTARRLCREMLQVDPDARISPSGVLRNAWILRPPKGASINTVPRIKMLDKMRREQKEKEKEINAGAGATTTTATSTSTSTSTTTTGGRTSVSNCYTFATAAAAAEAAETSATGGAAGGGGGNQTAATVGGAGGTAADSALSAPALRAGGLGAGAAPDVAAATAAAAGTSGAPVTDGEGEGAPSLLAEGTASSGRGGGESDAATTTAEPEAAKSPMYRRGGASAARDVVQSTDALPAQSAGAASMDSAAQPASPPLQIGSGATLFSPDAIKRIRTSTPRVSRRFDAPATDNSDYDGGGSDDDEEELDDALVFDNGHTLSRSV